RPLSRPALGARVPRRRRVARLLAEEARLPRRVARPPREGREARDRLGRREQRVLVPRPARRARAARAAADAELARAPVPAVIFAAILASAICAATPVHGEPLPQTTNSLSALRWVQATPHRAGI